MTTEAVHLEPLPDGSLLARIGGEDWQFGEPYEIMVVVTARDEDTCEIKGLDKLPTRSQWRKLQIALALKGYRFMEFDRAKDGVMKRHREELL